MRMKYLNLKLENFKCFKSKEVDFQGRNASVAGENGMGKTTLKDSVSWLFYGQDSSGRSAFAVRPLDADNNLIRGLVVTVELTMLLNGEAKTFRKEQHEKIDKDGKFSYPNKYWIDGFGMKEGEYKKALENIIPENIFKMLTDLDHFNNDKKLSRIERRKMLVELGGRIGEPPGFEGLIAKFNGHPVEDYKKVLTGRKKLFEDERDSNITRIDEKQLQLDNYAQPDNTADLETKRGKIQESIANLIKQRTELIASQKERQEHIEKKNSLIEERLHRESVVKNQSGPVDELLDERAKLETEHADKTQELVGLQNQIRSVCTSIESAKNDIAQSLLTLKSIKAEYKAAKESSCRISVNERTARHASGCKLAGDELRNIATEYLQDRDKLLQATIKDIEERSDKMMKSVDERKTHLLKQQELLAKLVDKQTTMVEELKTAEQTKNARIAEITVTIKNRPEPNPADDKEWQRLTAEIEKVKAQIGKPISEKLERIERRKQAAEDELGQICKTLAAADSIKDAEARIVELEARQKELAQLIVDVNAELDEIDQYNLAKSKMVEEAVNGKFRHVTFKLFEYYQNGEIKDCCVAVLNGVEYPDMSDGQKIFCGIGCINTMSDHFGVEVPVFVDHSESLTLPIEAESQVIRLVAKKGVKELEITLEGAQEEGKAKVA